MIRHRNERVVTLHLLAETHDAVIDAAGKAGISPHKWMCDAVKDKLEETEHSATGNPRPESGEGDGALFADEGEPKA